MNRGIRRTALQAATLSLQTLIAPVNLSATPSDVTTRWTVLDQETLKDGKSGLQWSRHDSGRELDWNEAKRYCADRRDGWRLADVEELAAIYDPSIAGAPCGGARCRISSQFDLTGTWFWSATPVGADGSDGPELAWGILMVTGARTPSVKEASYGARALCVRGKQS